MVGINFHRIIVATLLTALSVASHAETTLGIAGEEATTIGIYIKDIRNNKVIVERNSKLALTPASTMKTVTTATALSLLGADFRFKTECKLVGDYVSGSKSKWYGDLIVYSCGDPTLESTNFKAYNGFCDSIVTRLKQKGISAIEGQIVVEQPMKDAGVVPEWEVDDIAWAYGAGLFGFNYKDNNYTLFPVTEVTRPYVPDINVYLEKSDAGNNILRGVFSNDIYAFTTDTQNTKWSVNTSMPDPSTVFVAELTDALRKNGITLKDDYIEDCGNSEISIYTHKSPKAEDIMHSLMVRSDNLFAEGMLRATKSGDTRSNAIKQEQQLWSSRGVDSKYTIIRDGSGLARANKIAPVFLGGILEYMAKSDMADTYVNFFPRAAKEGTMKSFLVNYPKAASHIAMKTGSVNAVQCYAGYRLDDDGKPSHVIVVMVNGFFCPRAQVREAIEKLILKTF
jgi:D-alanyl-D-alanine carboxypeptidase/D-alanyl-D-alanine-endopeptidase (penicillin-binding protein 4)